MAYALHPAFGEAEIVDMGAGVRPSFPDNVPKIVVRGRTIHVNGLYRHGFLLAPALAELVGGVPGEGRDRQPRVRGGGVGTPKPIACRDARRRGSQRLSIADKGANIALRVTRETLPMIYEFRTYTLHPRTLPEFLKRFGDALEPRLKLSKLAAFWYTEIGPLNQVIHVWPYENTLERTKIRAEAIKAASGRRRPPSSSPR